MLVQGLSGARHIRIEGLLSHFAEAEDEDRSFSKKQAELFLKAVQSFREAGINPPLLHMENSAAIIAPVLSPSARAGAVEHKDAGFNLVRPGLMLYGAYPSERLMKKIDLKPALASRRASCPLRKLTRIFCKLREKVCHHSAIAVLPGYVDGYMKPFKQIERAYM